MTTKQQILQALSPPSPEKAAEENESEIDRKVFFDMRIAIALGLLCVVSLCGCPKGASTPTTPQASVGGSVTYDGTPVTLDANVVFYCKDSNATASGQVDSLGKYSLVASDKKVGIPAGRYQVGISPPVKVSPQAVDSPEYKAMMLGQSKPAPPPKDLPVKFHSYMQSGIILEVKAGENTFDFDLAKLEKAKK